ncbi:MAG: carboxy-S-adenosyl-L-methionine synthase CmoA [Steroidobacteraceae bacterium]
MSNPQDAPKDRVFAEKREAIGDFKFGAEVAQVFDDMLSRSVPFYGEIQRMVAELAQDVVTPGSRVYDLGCSTGTTLLLLDPILPKDVTFVGVDDSQDMLVKCEQKLKAQGVTRPIELQCTDLHSGVDMHDASLALMILTLQFLRPLHRERLVNQICGGLQENGGLILVEKVLGEDSHFNRLFIKHYYDFKRRNGYSETEIAQKREALENVLIPYKLLENRELLLGAGFRYVDVFFKWYNFCGIVAIK